MKRIAVVIGSVFAVAATPTVVAASQSDPPSGADIYQRAHTWSSPHGQLYGPVKVAPSSYGFLAE